MSKKNNKFEREIKNIGETLKDTREVINMIMNMSEKILSINKALIKRTNWLKKQLKKRDK